jgi:hypothetical protein
LGFGVWGLGFSRHHQHHAHSTFGMVRVRAGDCILPLMCQVFAVVDAVVIRMMIIVMITVIILKIITVMNNINNNNNNTKKQISTTTT